MIRLNPIPWLFAPGIALVGWLYDGPTGAAQALAGWAGLVTAATVWVNAAIGMAAGAGYYTIAIVATVTALLVLTTFLRIERRLEERIDGVERVDPMIRPHDDPHA